MIGIGYEDLDFRIVAECILWKLWKAILYSSSNSPTFTKHQRGISETRIDRYTSRMKPTDALLRFGGNRFQNTISIYELNTTIVATQTKDCVN